MKKRFDATEKNVFTKAEILDAQKIVSDDNVQDELFKYFAERTKHERRIMLNLQLELALKYKKECSLNKEDCFYIAMLFVKSKNHNYFSTVAKQKIKEELETKRKNKKRRMSQHKACLLYMSEFHQLKCNNVSTKDAIDMLYDKHRSAFWGQKPTEKVMRNYYLSWRKERGLYKQTEEQIVQPQAELEPMPVVENATLDIFRKIAEQAEEPPVAVPLPPGNENQQANI